MQEIIARDSKYQQAGDGKNGKPDDDDPWRGAALDESNLERALAQNDAHAALNVCGNICSLVANGVSHPLAYVPLSESILKLWFRARRVFASFLTHPELMKHLDLDITDCLWLAYAALKSAHTVSKQPDDIPALRSFSVLAGEMMRCSMDERAFCAVFAPVTPRMESHELITVCMIAATTTPADTSESSGDEKNEAKRAITPYTLPETTPKGALRVCEGFANLHTIDFERFCKLANRFSLAVLRGSGYVKEKLGFTVNASALDAAVLPMSVSLNSPNVQMTIDTAANDVNKLAIELCCPLMTVEDAALRIGEDSTISITTVFAQSIGVRASNKVRHHAQTPGSKVIKEPSNPYYDAWILVLFDRMVAAACGEHIVGSFVLLDAAWHKSYQKINTKRLGTAHRPPLIVRILNQWYVQVTSRSEALENIEVLQRTDPTAPLPTGAVLIACEDITTCVRLFYLLVKRLHRYVLREGVSIKALAPLFDPK